MTLRGGGGLSCALSPALPQVCEQSCAALCVLALRKPENGRVIVEGGGALAALRAMKTHPQEVGVQVRLASARGGHWRLRWSPESLPWPG